MLGYQQEYQIQVKQYYKYCHHCGRHHEATNTGKTILQILTSLWPTSRGYKYRRKKERKNDHMTPIR